jgi:hypothetical protein
MAKKWVQDIFRAKQVELGGVVRRSRYWVDRYNAWRDLEEEVGRRGFHMEVRNGNVLVFCNNADDGSYLMN